MNDASRTRAPAVRHTFSLDFTEDEADELLEYLHPRLGHGASLAARNLFLRLRAQRCTPPPQPPPAPPAMRLLDQHGNDTLFAPPQPVRPVPERQPCRGTVFRKVDVSGISGLGHIAEFCVFSDGGTAIRWLGGPPQNEAKFEFFDNKGIDPFLKISGHNGNTEICWIDEPEHHA